MNWKIRVHEDISTSVERCFLYLGMENGYEGKQAAVVQGLE